jgi:hypothetical protein
LLQIGCNSAVGQEWCRSAGGDLRVILIPTDDIMNRRSSIPEHLFGATMKGCHSCHKVTIRVKGQHFRGSYSPL